MVLVVQCRQKAEGWLWRTGTDIVHTNDRLCAGYLHCGKNILFGLITGTLWHKVPVTVRLTIVCKELSLARFWVFLGYQDRFFHKRHS